MLETLRISLMISKGEKEKKREENLNFLIFNFYF
jgi:hypothetical protein